MCRAPALPGVTTMKTEAVVGESEASRGLTPLSEREMPRCPSGLFRVSGTRSEFFSSWLPPPAAPLFFLPL